jgi:hypothetical protein
MLIVLGHVVACRAQRSVAANIFVDRDFVVLG